MTDHRPLVSIVCPAYREEEALPKFHAELSRVLAPLESQYEFEILYIDDGSRDRTLDAMKLVGDRDPRVRVLSLSRNFGKEVALQAGLENAEGELIITMDTDLQHPPELIPQLLEKANGPVDLVITVRQEYQKPGWFKQLGTQTFYKILGALSEIEIRQETSDYLLMKRKVAAVLLRMQEKHRYMKGLVHWMGFAYLEVPFTPKERTVGTTKFSFLRLLALGKDCLFSFSKKPLTLATWLGSITLLVGLAWAMTIVVQLILGTSAADRTAQYLIVSSHVLAGSILLTVGILGEYVGRIWEQVRSRPNYLLKYDSHEAALRTLAHQPPHIKVFETPGAERARKDQERMNNTEQPEEATAFLPLGRWEKIGLGLVLLLFVAFGLLVEQRSAFLDRRMGDLDVFLRAAWAVRNDADLYAITSDNDWHYIYPPLYAILLAPLADPPKAADHTGYVPYALSVAICYLLSCLSLFAGAHVLAKALEERVLDGGQPRYCRRWWFLRLWPVLICFLPLGHTLMRGQANVIVLAMLCAAMAGWIRGQSLRAGLWLAFAICIKVIPVYLLVYPLWKRDGRALAGVAVGCFIGLVLIPVATFGPTKTVTHYETYAKAFFGPFFAVYKDDRSREEIATTDSIGVKNAIHNWTYPDQATRPEDMNAMGKGAYLLLGFGMTFLTLWPGTRRQGESPARTASVFGCLILLMTIFSPVSHRHYLLFCLPIVMCLLAATWNKQATLRVPWGLIASFVVFNVTMFVAYLPNLEDIMKDRCAALFATLPLWVILVWELWRPPMEVSIEAETRAASRAA